MRLAGLAGLVGNVGLVRLVIVAIVGAVVERWWCCRTAPTVFAPVSAILRAFSARLGAGPTMRVCRTFGAQSNGALGWWRRIVSTDRCAVHVALDIVVLVPRLSHAEPVSDY